MAIKSILKPQESVVSGIATGVLVYAIYNQSVPNTAVMHATPANDINIEAGRKKATWTAAGVLAGVTLLTRDANVFILGGIVLIALDWHTRIANASAPDTGKLVSPGGEGISGQGYADSSGQGNTTAPRLTVVS
jgi:hypothetical protein